MPVTLEITGLQSLDALFRSIPQQMSAGVKLTGPAVDFIHSTWPKITADDKMVLRFVQKIRFASGNACWEWTAAQRNNYGEIMYRGKIWQAHALSYLFAHGPFGDWWTLHKCDNPPCVRPDHLFLGTALDNNLDTRAKGRAPWQTNPNWASWVTGDNHWGRRHPERTVKGSAAGRAKLVEADVLVIRQKLAQHQTKASIAREYHVSESLIYAIQKQEIWRHI